ncbi:MAG: response regulator [Planctomycetota bacterium]
MRFLTVDDDQAILTLVENLIYNLGHETVGCLTEEEAKQVEGEIHGVIVDWHLGDTTCEPLTRELKNRYPGVPIMMITGDSDLDLIQSALALGVQDWWFKPTGLENLKAQIKSMIADAARARSRQRRPEDRQAA